MLQAHIFTKTHIFQTARGEIWAVAIPKTELFLMILRTSWCFKDNVQIFRDLSSLSYLFNSSLVGLKTSDIRFFKDIVYSLAMS